uniref:Sialate O-acetylesterase domain-containing protein n=1 Tax=Lactuca sativa TaxID=4236 RepID=A0A9R1XUK2_LACSA|nr:hypothetical protein LSAT_V11C100009450 [Lactuca sativa]
MYKINLSFSVSCVALASESGPYTIVVREAQLEMKLANLKTVDAMGLSLQQPENLHLTTPSQVSLGKILTKSFLQVCHYHNL